MNLNRHTYGNIYNSEKIVVIKVFQVAGITAKSKRFIERILIVGITAKSKCFIERILIAKTTAIVEMFKLNFCDLLGQLRERKPLNET